EELRKELNLPGDGRTEMQLQAFYKSLKVDKFDYQKQMLLVIQAGTQARGGFKVEVTRVEPAKEGKVLRVHWKLYSPSGAGTDAITHPALAVVVDRFDGPVEFVLDPK